MSMASPGGPSRLSNPGAASAPAISVTARFRIGRGHALEGNEEEIRDTVLHEIAHAIAGPEAGHGPLWKATARRIGATPRAKTYDGQSD